MSLGLLARQPLTWDSEAAAYILQVEAADGQSLELGVARAINQFVIDCKVRGIWGAIKSCCLLSGARTLNGALRPLKGAAPTNINFINSDYNRETGLKGDGSSKYINTNRNYASDPQNNQHMCVYISSPDSKDQALGSVGYIAAGTSTGAGNIGKDGSNSRIYFRNQNSTVYTTNFNISEGVGLIGSSRTNSDSYSIRLVGRNLSFNQSSQTPLSSNIFIFAFPGSPATFYTNARLSFYSIGESLDLRLLEQCVNKLNDSLYRLFYPTSLHPEALTWINSAQSNNNPRISATLANAISIFCNSIDSNNLRNKFYRLNLFCGPSLTTAIRPLYRGPAPTGTQYGNTTDQSSGFSNTAHYSEFGLQGTIASSTYLETGLLTTTINSLYPSVHFSVYANNTPTLGEFIAVGDGSTKYQLVGEFAGQFLSLIGGTFQTAPLYSTPSGMNLTSRTATNLVRLYRNGSYVTQNTNTISSPPSAAGTGWSTQGLRLFANIIQNNSPAAYSNIRSCGYSVGIGFTQEEATNYYNIMQAFQTSLGRQV